ncbi:hypothetical protein [Pseudoalteromonas gelatinilytica]|uniref:Chromosome segregation ATPase n=1 Tax=Pseudoalteromonas gelatinilytica TaxID=1703256 RepID=A0ABQ1TRH9_9GAMM|nr:hypothetical protein [Pseudoalteromonas profundi]GGF00722.1 hypothetical protein GCM10008027_27030 [Pseudoalteromonas profundi]
MIAKGFVTEFLNAALSSSITVGAIFFFARIFFKGYIDQKSKNLATKQDVGEITDIVEKIKHENAQILEKIKAEHAEKLEDIRRENQLLVATVDKHLDLKIKIYTDAIESFTVLTNSLANLCKLSLTESEFTSIIEKEVKSISKVKIVGSVETCIATVEFMTAFNCASLELQKHRTSLIICNDRINYLEGKDKLETFEHDELEHLIASEPSEYIEFTALCMEKYNEVANLTTRYVKSVREELGFEIDFDELTTSEADSSNKLKNSFESFLGGISKY